MSSKWDNSKPSVSFGRRDQAPLLTIPLSDEERSAGLEKSIIEQAHMGWKVQHQSSFFASLSRGKRPNHILHLLLALITFGLWLPVWFILGVTMGERTRTIDIDKFGNLTIR